MAVQAAELVVQLRAKGVSETEGGINRVSGAVDKAASGFDAFFASIQGGAGNALRALDGIAQVIGALSVAGGITLIAGGAKAAWAQVSAVEQATVALRAYEKDASKVDKVLQDLVAYARSDMGVLFQRQDLFAAAQGLKVMGAETQNLTRYVEIMSRSVGIGAGTWEDLTRVIGRVGATGKLTSDDFDSLTKAGFQLDQSLRGAAVTWDELFDALDRGIPADAMLGQANTIEGMLIRLQSAIRGIGTAFLGVDADTSQFISGGLGDRLTSWLRDAPGMIRNFQGAAADLGNAIAGVIDFVSNMVGAFQMLPQPVQTAATTILKLVAAFGALRVAGKAMGMIGALTGLGGLAGGIGSLLGGGGMFKGGAAGATTLGSSLSALVGRINPLGLAMTGVIAIGASWVNSFMQQKKAADEYAGSVSNLASTLETLRRQGMRDRAAQGEGLAGIIDNIDERSLELMERWSEGYENFDDAEMKRFTEFQEVSIAQQEQLNTLLNEALLDPNIDVDAWMNWVKSLLTGIESAEELKANVELILATPLSDFALDGADAMNELDGSMQKVGATAAEVSDIFADLPARIDDLRIDGLDKQADDLEKLGTAMEKAFQPIVEYQTDRNGQDTGLFTIIDELDSENLDMVANSWQRISDAISSGDFDNARLIADVMAVLNDPTMSLDAKAMEIERISVNLHEYSNALSATQEAMRDWLAEGDNILEFWLEYNDRMNQGAAMMDGSLRQMQRMERAADFRALVQFTVDLNNASDSLDRALYYFEQIDQLGQRSASSGSIAENLVGKPGEWATIDDLLTSGRISQEQYNETAAAGYSIMESNARVQQHLNKMRADQLPLLEEEQLAYEKQIEALSQLPALEQRRALALQDSGYQAQIASMYSTAYAASIGEIPEDVATSIIVSAAEADPILKDLLLNFGLIEEGADGEIRVNFPDGDTVQDSIASLTESIDALIVAMGGTPPAAQAMIDAMGGVGSAARDAAQALFDLDNAPKPNARSTDSNGNQTWGNTGVPVVTGLPEAGTGSAVQDQTITITADISDVQEKVAQVSAMMFVIGGLSSSVTMLADESDVRTKVAQVSALMFIMDSLTATVSILGNAAHALGVLASMSLYNGRTIATTYIDIATRQIGTSVIGRATGGFVSEPMTLVGERGPELVSLPQGSYVHTNAESMRMMRGSGNSGDNNVTVAPNAINVTVNASTDADPEEIATLSARMVSAELTKAVYDRRTGMGA